MKNKISLLVGFIAILSLLLFIGYIDKNNKIKSTVEALNSEIENLSSRLNNQEILIDELYEKNLVLEEVNKALSEENTELHNGNEYGEKINNNLQLEVLDPIDNYFNEHPLLVSSHSLTIEYSKLRAVCWKNEMYHAYELLISNSNEKVKQDLIDVRDLFIEYTDLESEISLLSFMSNAFQSTDSDELQYGTAYYHFKFENLAAMYKDKTLILHDILRDSEIEYSFVFNSDELQKEILQFTGE